MTRGVNDVKGSGLVCWGPECALTARPTKGVDTAKAHNEGRPYAQQTRVRFGKRRVVCGVTQHLFSDGSSCHIKDKAVARACLFLDGITTQLPGIASRSNPDIPRSPPSVVSMRLRSGTWTRGTRLVSLTLVLSWLSENAGTGIVENSDVIMS